MNRRLHVLTLVATLAFQLTASAQMPSGPSSERSISLDEAIAMACSNSPSIEAAHAAVSNASAHLTSAKSGYLPRLSVSEEVVLSTDPVFSFGTLLRQARFTSEDFALSSLNHPSPIANFASKAEASWTVFDTGETLKRARGAKEEANAASLDESYTGQQVAFTVMQNYYRALLAEEQIQTVRAAAARGREFAADTHDRVAAGLALQSDELQADLAFQNQEDDIAEAISNSGVAHRQLAEDLGDANDRFTLVSETSEPQEQAASMGEGLDQLLASLSHREDLSALFLKEQAAKANLSAVKLSAGPRVTAFGSVEADNPDFASGGSGNWTIGARLEMNVLDGGKRKAETFQAGSDVAQAHARYDAALRRARMELARAWADRENAKRRYNTASSALESAKETLQTAHDRYDAGLLSVTEVLGQQEQLRSFEFLRLRALYQWWTAEGAIRLATGMLTVGKTGQHP